MRKTVFAATAFAALALGGAFASAQAAPALGTGLSISHDGSVVDKVWWKRVCDRDGDRCRRVWIGDRDRDDHGWRWRRWCRWHPNRC